MRKIREEELERRAQITKRGFREWFERVKEDPDAVPDKTVIFTWSEDELTEVFTKERLRLFRRVRERTYTSIKELAVELGRDESRVRKDLKILEEYGLVELTRKGRNIEVKSDVQAIYIPIEGVPIEELERVTT